MIEMGIINLQRLRIVNQSFTDWFMYEENNLYGRSEFGCAGLVDQKEAASSTGVFFNCHSRFNGKNFLDSIHTGPRASEKSFRATKQGALDKPQERHNI